MKWITLIVLCISLQVSAQDSGWTVETLKEYTDMRFDAVSDAIVKADAYTRYRDEKQNEFRQALDDQNITFARKEYVENLEKQLDEVKAKITEFETLRTGGSATIAYLMAGISFLIAIVALSRNFIASIYKQNMKI